MRNNAKLHTNQTSHGNIANVRPIQESNIQGNIPPTDSFTFCAWNNHLYRVCDRHFAR